MRKAIIEYAKTITKNTPLAEVAKVAKSEAELEYIIKEAMKKDE